MRIGKEKKLGMGIKFARDEDNKIGEEKMRETDKIKCK